MMIKGKCSECREYGSLNPRGHSLREGVCDRCIYKVGRKIHEEKRKKEEERRLRIKLVIAPALEMIDRGDFLNADRFVLEKHSEELFKEYERKKIECVKTDMRNLEKELGEKEGYFDEEKAGVLAKTGKYILVQARAGSGKTTTIALKVRQLIKYYGAKPEEILVLAFNKKAAEEFKVRIKKYCGSDIATENNTLTFHALAKRIANSEKTQLVDKELFSKEDNCHGKDERLQIDFVQDCFNDIKKRDRGAIGVLFHLFLKSASEKIRSVFRNDREYYLYLRNQEYTTIAGEFVKSIGEKYIADFLFEHEISKNNTEISYTYEYNIKKHLNIKYPYKPDFSLFYKNDERRNQLQAVIEYFGFTENNPGYHYGYQSFLIQKKNQKNT